MRQHVRNSLHSRLPEMRPSTAAKRIRPQQGQPSNRRQDSSSHISFGREPQRGTGASERSSRYQENEPCPDHFAPRPMGPRPVYHRNIDAMHAPSTSTTVLTTLPIGAYYRYVPNYGYEEIAVPTDVSRLRLALRGPTADISTRYCITRPTECGSSLLTMVI